MLLENEKLHFTDISFAKYCEYNFNINRGTYNTIDEWLYEQGETNILSRRLQIIDFLTYINKTSSGKIKFGKGGLSDKLHQFFRRRYAQKQVSIQTSRTIK